MRIAKLLTALTLTAAGTTACSDSSIQESAPLQEGQTAVQTAVGFTTYTSRAEASRSGAYGAIDTDRLKESDYGFGVFAYKTGGRPYSTYRTQNAATGRYPNFMYNEHIVYDGSKWVYEIPANVKYWPNETEANADNTNGGNVSFFAYGPYAKEGSKTVTPDYGIDEQLTSDTDHQGHSSGIIAFSTPTFNGGNAQSASVEDRYRYSDPYVKYRIAADLSQQVDLLWGTTTGSSANVNNNSLQYGASAATYPDFTNDNTEITSGRPDYNVPTDLTKQKTNGTVSLHFKHALAKIGGSYVGTDDGSDEDGATPTNGLMVVLDIDKDGSASGSTLYPYIEGPTAGTPYNTKVTVNSIGFECARQLTDEGREAIGNGTFDFDSHTAQLCNTAILNLATGVWSNHEYRDIGEQSDNAPSTGQTIVPSQDNGGPLDQSHGAILAKEIAEPTAFTTTAYTRQRFEELPIGVTTVAKNVYESQTAPFLYIPGTCPVFTITIDYTVRTYDAKLANNYTEVRQKISKHLYILDSIELNKRYNILMHLGLTSVKFTATVDDWDNTTPSATTTTDTATGAPITVYDEEVEHVYLPANVE